MPQSLYTQASDINSISLTRLYPFPQPDVKADNVLFIEGTAPETIKKLLDESPQIIDGEFELKGAHYPIMRSQPIPHPFLWNDPPITVELYSLFLTDLGSGKHSFFVQCRLLIHK